MSIAASAILFLLGLSFGSFLNVITLRYSPRDRFFRKFNFFGRSFCPHCKKTLFWYELIPVLSYLIQLGKCRSCGHKLTLQYPLVELISGIIFLSVPLFLKKMFLFYGIYSNFYWIISSFLWIAVFLLLLLVFIIDIRHYVIPNAINLSLFIIALMWVFCGVYFKFFENINSFSFLGEFFLVFPSFSSSILNHIFGLFLAGAFFFGIVLFSFGKAMGMGDVKLISSLGLLFGWPDVALVIFLSFMIGAVASFLLLIFKKKKMADLVPFGPFIVVSSALAFFFGAGLIRVYFDIIGL